MPLVEYAKVVKNFGTYKAVDDLSMNLQQDQVFCFLGHNGAGKTTALNMLIGLHKPTQGNIYMNQ